MVKIYVLRLGHRTVRDKRVSTHCGLVARAFGAEGMYYSGEHDSELERSVADVVSDWGGPFFVEHVEKWREFLKKFKGEKIHLTMYGLPWKESLGKLDAKKDKLIIVGGAKVPWDVYDTADFNVAVTSQPHSEIAALGVFLEGLSGEKKEFKDAKQRIKPSEKGKEVVRG